MLPQLSARRNLLRLGVFLRRVFCIAMWMVGESGTRGLISQDAALRLPGTSENLMVAHNKPDVWREQVVNWMVDIHPIIYIM
jgi:hypothetical protein